MASFATVLVRRDGPVGFISLNRPSKSNAIDDVMFAVRQRRSDVLQLPHIWHTRVAMQSVLFFCAQYISPHFLLRRRTCPLRLNI